jgi:hypothetical protein
VQRALLQPIEDGTCHLSDTAACTKRFFKEDINLAPAFLANGLSMLMEVFTYSINSFIRGGARSFNEPSYHFVRSLVYDITDGLEKACTLILSAAQDSAKMAQDGMIVAFVVNFLAVAMFYVFTYRTIIQQLTIQMEQTASIVFMLPNDIVIQNQQIKQCIETGGASLLEDQN